MIVLNAALITDPPMLAEVLKRETEAHGLPLEVRFVVPDWTRETVGEAFGLEAEKAER